MLTITRWCTAAACSAACLVLLVGCQTTSDENQAGATRADESQRYAADWQDPWRDIDPDPKARPEYEDDYSARLARAEVRPDAEQPSRPVAEAPRANGVSSGGARAAAGTGAAVTAADGWVRGRIAFPTGETATSALLLEKSLPAEVIAGKPFEYEIKATNISKNKLDSVEVVEVMPSNFKVAESSGARLTDGAIRFPIGTLAPGESKTVKVTGTAGQQGSISSCLTASYDTALCMSTNVVAPALALALSVPAEVLACEVVPVKVQVTNRGSGAARNVRVEAALPAGMTTGDGRNAIAFDAGTLAAGQTREATFNAKLAKAGRYETKASAKGEGGLLADSTPAVTLAKLPVLELTTSGPEKQFIGRPVTYDITVKNTGDGIAREATLVNAVPADCRFDSATEGGRQAAGKVQWALGDLAPGASKKVSYTVMPASATTLKSQATAQARCAEAVTASAQTSLAGIPALLLETIDVTDPLEVGQNQTYVISVTNQGSAPGTGIKIVANLEDQMEFASASGQTRGTAQGKTVTFEPLANLPPKAKATWQVVVKATGTGDVRFKVNMTADQLTRPVEETESSNFFK
jgi:uncharacterized repeat protein (TIGR01451 family)